MRSTLLLRLAGPMQSWGIQSRFSVRDTGLEPSKSGVIGLLCAALGWPRQRPVDSPEFHLARLHMGVRVDREGELKRDYQTAGGTHRRDDTYGVRRASGKPGETVTSNRYYLADADFLVGLEGEDDPLLLRLYSALREAKWQLFLGRKAFVPGVPVFIPDGLRLGLGLEEALTKYPWPRWDLSVPPPERRSEPLRLVLETRGQTKGAEVRMDQPQGAAYQRRYFLPRYVTTKFCQLDKDVPIRDQ